MSNKNDKPFAISGNSLEVFGAVLRHGFVHVREISRIAKVSPTTASMILKGLEKKGIVKGKTLGKNRFYTLEKNSSTRKMICMLEDYRFMKRCSDQGFLESSERIMKGIDDIKNLIDVIIAYRQGDKDDKICLLFITSLDSEKLRPRVGSGIEFMVMNRDNLKDNACSEMIMRMMEDHAVIKGAERLAEILY